MSESTVSVRRIAQISIRVTDVERSAAFYQRKLGLPLLYSQSNMALLDCGGIRLLLGIAETPEFDHPSSTVYFQVEDLDDACRKLTAEGVEFRGKPHKVAEFGGMAVWMAFFYDPDRNVHALTSEVPIG
ncbi:VOC family protein [Cohnella sp. CFH 77786]|uniref:VOC family protein n=1 Tax=Cohnella sp. CFH 77786 TaxID=2662265 RepID=UPI001C60866D|nr:VOC family protein [Cohnella sp. CFH 77786]MBW5446003.1 VOC family protein [Cohnella sp. CFH 77786]